ncbi:hypothetical protein H8B09_22750 [Paenibacillus sp. PR3]|uniref:DUF3221 domain-containing protein n=1 Tax=Paenibacillus terricola TaxID=2763503 RepID=A0ABR8N2V5_9BACL|nr:hypothetical protein [Paenibacillus terricola]MBD3921606.1 hypothetical protein [Paenibacillus terricola]
MYKFLATLVLVIFLSGCNGTSGDEFTISGKVTAIDKDKQYVYVDKQAPIKYEKYDELEIGQQVTFVLNNTNKDDVWDPETIKVKSFKTP